MAHIETDDSFTSHELRVMPSIERGCTLVSVSGRDTRLHVRVRTDVLLDAIDPGARKPESLDDALERAWEAAEVGTPRVGDRLIGRSTHVNGHGTHEYFVGLSPENRRHHAPGVRILERAPEPQPAWHDAQAIRATYDGARLIFVRSEEGDWFSADIDVRRQDQLEFADVEIILDKDA